MSTDTGVIVQVDDEHMRFVGFFETAERIGRPHITGRWKIITKNGEPVLYVEFAQRVRLWRSLGLRRTSAVRKSWVPESLISIIELHPVMECA